MAGKSDIQQIEECIDLLISKFRDCPRYFCSESDLQSYLYHLLILKDKFRQKRVTGSGYSIGLVHTEYSGSGVGRFDLAILDPQHVGKLPISKQKILCGIEIGLNRNYAHFTDDYASPKFIKGAPNEVSFGYILHFVRGTHIDWETVVNAAKETAQTNECSVFRIIETQEAKALAVRIDVTK